MRTLINAEPSDVRLVCFPHSGGTAAVYRAWAPVVPAGVELLAVQYPGRADRFSDPPAADIAEMGAQVAAELLRRPPARCALFGHSLGALVAYETARALQDRGSPVHCLFVSGAAAPSLAGGGVTHQLNDEEFWATVAGLGGIEPEIASEPELQELLLPVLRSDITLHETYQPAPEAGPLGCPVRAYYHTDDPIVDADRVIAWAEVSAGEFSTRAWPGGHFQLLTDPAELVADIVGAMVEGGMPQ